MPRIDPLRVTLALLAMLGPLLVPSHARAQGTGSVSAAMDAVYERFTRAYRLGQPDSVVALYTDAPLYLPARGPVRQGREELRAQFGFLEAIRARSAIAHIEFESVDRGFSGDAAWDVGYYTLSVQEPDGTRTPPGRGKFATVWRRGPDGQWRIHVDSFSPAPPPGGAGAAPADPRAEIVALIERTQTANNEGDVEGWVDLFALDFVYMAPGAPAVTTRDALVEVARAGFRHEADIDIEPEEIEVAGDWAFARSRVTGTVRLADSDRVVTVDSKQIAVYRRTPGGWRIARLIMNGNAP